MWKIKDWPKKLLTINLPDGRKIKLTHVCNIHIPGLPVILTGHIIPDLKIASLIGICLLRKVGCKVILTMKNVMSCTKVTLFYEGTKTQLRIYGLY
jgi:hypothetical protein